MTVQDLKTFYEYHYWANKKILHAVALLNPDEFTQTLAGGFGSVRNTLVHLLSTEWGWLDRCGGHKRGSSLSAEDYPTIDLLVRDWENVESYMHEFLSQLDDEDLQNVVEYVGGENNYRSMPLGDLLHHIIIHAVHHRGQIAMLLRELDYNTENFDILFYYAEKRGAKAW